MTISEKKTQIVIDNYFKSECDVNTSIRQAFEKGFKIGIKKVPSADAVEVVRCKDCKYSHMTYDGLCKYCDEWDEDGEALYLEGDFYCAWGERREDGEA